MTLGLIFIGVGLVWLLFRKWIARCSTGPR